MPVVILIVVIIALVVIVNCVKIVPQAHAVVVERLGGYLTTWSVGLHFKVPFIDRIAKRVLLKEQVVDFPPQPVITKDNVTMQIDTVVYFQITDPKLYAYGVENPIMAIENLTATTLRNIIGDLELDEASADKEKAAALKAEYEAKLKEIDKEAETILADARQKALKNQNRIVNEAKEEAARIVKHAQEEALLEKKHAMNDMKQEMITVASLMAQKVVASSITAEIQSTLVDETLKEMGESTWQN